MEQVIGIECCYCTDVQKQHKQVRTRGGRSAYTSSNSNNTIECAGNQHDSVRLPVSDSYLSPDLKEMTDFTLSSL